MSRANKSIEIVNVAYILYNERPMSGLLRGQVIDMLTNIVTQNSDIRLTVICLWQPFLMLTARKELDRMRKGLASEGIAVEYYFLCPPNRFFAFSSFMLRLLAAYNSFFIRKILADRFTIVHTRAYYAGFFVEKIKKKSGFKHVFDLRSLFPDEMLASGILSESDDGYRLWKKVEKETVSNADECIAVSDSMKTEILKIDPTASVTVIPLCVNAERAKAAISNNQRVLFPDNIDKLDKNIVAYCGSLSLHFNNDVKEYARYFNAISRVRKDVHFLIISQTPAVSIKNWLDQEGVDRNLYSICEAREDELFQLLSRCDFGLLVMRPGADRETRLGVKFVEYLTAGLPVLANRNVGAAAKMIQDFKLGQVVDLDGRGEISSPINLMFDPEPSVRSHCQEFARRNFNTSLVAKKYYSIYKKL